MKNRKQTNSNQMDTPGLTFFFFNFATKSIGGRKTLRPLPAMTFTGYFSFYICLCHIAFEVSCTTVGRTGVVWLPLGFKGVDRI